MHDQRVLDRIATLIDQKAGPQMPVVEVGPGRGALTECLLPLLGMRLYCIELDPRMVEYLRETIPQLGAHLIEADFLQWQPDADLLNSGFVVAGNFPYNISTQIVFKILQYRACIPVMLGMFQKEVGQRIAAPHGGKDYGILSVLAQTYYDVQYHFDIAPGSFNPPPNVMSGVISMTLKKEVPDVPYPLLMRVVKAAFNQRRKMLRNALQAGGFKVDGVEENVLKKRAEQLSVTDFQALAGVLQANL